MHDGGVVPPTKGLADAGGGKRGHSAAYVHGHLPGQRNLLAAVLAGDVLGGGVVLAGDHLDDQLGRHGAGGLGTDAS